MTNVERRAETSSAILATAARVLAERPGATVGEIATVSGVGRATVYRYFPTREGLLQALERDGIEELASQFDGAGRDNAPVPEVVQRLLGVLLAMSDRYTILSRQQAGPTRLEHAAEVDRLVAAPIRAVFQRGIDDGTLRRGFDADVLGRSLAGLAIAAVEAGLPGRIGVDAAAELVTSLLLDGARRSKSKQRSKSKSKHATAE